ncbi:MAG: 1-acyl-sn-glycerol-3-phosphate acyltransferase [bacterium]|nr:1-acyl-sn-glycerol-3-phosphate acyltransferase [bacterium]
MLTLFLWTYFTAGYVLFFAPFYPIIFIFSKEREASFQKLHSRFYRVFFIMVKALIPPLTIDIPEEVKNIRSSVIISNHISYLDPILLISLFEKQKTIVKGAFFKVPIFAQALKLMGFIPFSNESSFSSMLIEELGNLKEYLNNKGIIFIFPEGTRSKDGTIHPFQKGAFYIAKECNVPLEMLYIKNTNVLFKPGKFFFRAYIRNKIEIERIHTIYPDQLEDLSANKLRKMAQEIYREKAGGER